MKMIANILKYLSLVLLIFFLLKFTKHFGDYKQTVYDTIFISFIIILILINILILYKVQKRTKNYKIIKILFLVGFIGVIFNLVSNYFARNREPVSKYEITPNADLTLYTNKTFQIIEYSPHMFQYWNGTYTISDDSLYLRDVDFDKIRHLKLSQTYILDTTSGNYSGNEYDFLKMKRQ